LVEHAHLAEEVARRHQPDHRLAVVDRVGDGDSDATAQHDVQRVRFVALAEQHVAANEVVL